MEAKLFIFAAVAISEVYSACEPTNSTFVNFQKSPRRSIPFDIGVTTNGCPGLSDFYYEWKIVQQPGGEIVQRSDEPTIHVNGYDYDSKVCFTSEYFVNVKVSHQPDMSSSDETSESFVFVPDNMHIEIVGGFQIPHTFGKDLVVDAESQSRDTSYPKHENAFEGNDVSWLVTPEIENFTLPKSLVLTIPASLISMSVTYTFIVNVTRTKIPGFEDSKIAIQYVEVVSENTPNVKLKCTRNCILPHSKESTVFEVNCISGCKNLTYVWLVTPIPSPESLEFGNGYDKILIKPNTYKAGTIVVVTFFVHGISIITTLRYVSKLVRGKCAINPRRGISGITKFKITCKGFHSPYGLSVSMIYQKSATDPSDIVLLNEFIYRDENEVYLPAGQPVILRVVVEDHAFSQRQVVLRASVTRYQPAENILVASSVKKLVLSRDSASITTFSLEGFYNTVVQLINSFLETMRNISMDKASTRDLHKHMVEALMQIQPTRLSSAFQRVLILCKVEKFKIKTDTVTSSLIGKMLLANTLNVHLMYCHKQNIIIPHFNLRVIVEYSFRLCSELLQENNDILTVLNYEPPLHEYDSYDEFISEKVQIRDNYRSLMTNVIVTIQTLCLTSLYTSIPDESAHKYDTFMILIETRRRLLQPLTNEQFTLSFFTFQKSKVILPPELMKELQKKYTYLDYQFGVFKVNPFWWHKSASTLNTRPVLFDLFIHCNKITKLARPFLIYLELISLPKKVIVGTLSLKDVAVYKVELQPKVTLVVEFFNEGNYSYDYLVTWSDCVCTENDFSSERSKIISGREGSINYERIMRVENGKIAKHIYICLKKSSPILSYRFLLATFSCMYWDIIQEKWNKYGCKVIEPIVSNNESLICECNHVSLFMGQILTPLVSEIFNSDIDFTISFVKNYVMVIFIAGLIFLWVFSLTLSHLKDKSLKKKNVIYKLDDNVPGDSNPYLIVVFTGVFYDAQTTADVAFKLVGDKAKSRTHLIKCKNTTLLKRNSQDWLILYTPSYLGNIKRLKLWHNSKGRHPHWYCDRVIVQDLKVGEQYCFTVKKWFSVIWGSGRIYREFRLNRPTRKMSNILFMTQLERNMKDKHIWLSIVTRDFQSNFNSKERVSTGFCFLFLSMLANALLYGIPHNAPSDSIDQQSSFDVGAKNIIIFIESWLAATPLSFLVYFFFENSKPI